MKKTRKTLTVVLLSLLLVSLLFGCNDKKNNNDTPDAPTEVIHLNSDNFVSELTKNCHNGASFILDSDIVLSGEWTPIGRTFSTSFNGTLDGNGKTITGLKTTGWDYDGTPVTILKRILGWKADGTPVYSSSEVIDMKTQDTAGYKEVLSIVREGDNADPDYQDMAENGSFENKTSYGSMGLFGYTNGATIKNLRVEGADFEFYGEGDNVYAGIISGYDIGSDFTDIELQGCSIRASSIDHTVISYYPENARPSSADKVDNDTKQYLGGIVGYSRGNAIVNGTSVEYKSTNFTSVSVKDMEINNYNYSAFFDSRLDVPNADKTVGSASSILATELEPDEGFGFYTVYSIPRRVTQAFIGGVSAYSVGAVFKNVDVNGLNKEGNYISGKKLNAAGVTAALLGAESKAEEVNVFDIRLLGKEIDIAAMIGGAFGEVKSATVSGNNGVSDVVLSAKGLVGSIESACVGGFAAYEDEGASLTGITVEGLTAESNYTDSGKLGSVLAGIVGVLRDSTLDEATVKKADFVIINSEIKKEYYRFVRTAVAQVYGNSVLGSDIKSYECTYETSNTPQSKMDVIEYDAANEKALVYPVLAKNNYVNEDGESSVRLYYTVDGKQAGVYVTVYGNLIPLMKDTGYRLHAETIWVALDGEPEKDINDSTKVKADGTYYYYYINDKTGEAHWNNIHTNASDDAKEYRTSRIYGLPETWFRVEAPVGAAMTTTYYTYNESTGRYSAVTGSFESGKTYYVRYEDANVGAYELDVNVYTESDKKIVVTKGKTEDDDIVAEATYSIAKSAVDAAVGTETDVYGNVYQLCPAEIFLDTYFANGAGFKADKNGFTIRDAEGTQNRDFAKYELVSGRPNGAENKVEYKSSEE